MTTKFIMSKDINGSNGFGLEFSDTNYNTTLSTSVEQNFTVPSNQAVGTTGSSKWLAIFSFDPGSSVWVANNSTAALPDSSFATTLSQLNPAARVVRDGDVLSFITADTTAEVGVELYAIS